MTKILQRDALLVDNAVRASIIIPANTHKFLRGLVKWCGIGKFTPSDKEGEAMGKSARLLADEPDKSEIAEDLLFKVGVLGRCGICGETVVVKNVYDSMDKLVSVVHKAHPHALKSYFDDDPVIMKDYIADEYTDAPFQCGDCNEKFEDDA